MYKVIKWNKYPTLRDDLKLQHPIIIVTNMERAAMTFVYFPFLASKPLELALDTNLLKFEYTIPLERHQEPAFLK